MHSEIIIDTIESKYDCTIFGI